MKNRPYKKGTTVDETSTVLTMRTGPLAKTNKTLFGPVNIFNFYLELYKNIR